MKLNKKLEIGINAITALQKREGFTRTKDIAEEVGTTVAFLEQIMRNLRTQGLVSVKRGPGGGYSLNKEQPVSAYAVANAVGRDFGMLAEQTTANARLQEAIRLAFINTKI